MEGSIRENITFVREDATDEMIEAAIQSAGLGDFVAQLPYGYDEWLGDCGYSVSGGQRQRIGLARALVREPDILILDEATSALDETLDQQIRRTIWNMFDRRTVVVVTHDLSVVQEMDHIVCLTRDGKVAEEGSPSRLLANRSSVLQRMLQDAGRTQVS